jgi:hypothetical protein
MGSQKIVHTDFRMNGLVEKPRRKRTVGLFQTILLASALRAGASWALFSGPGRLSSSFSSLTCTNYKHDWSPFANPLYSSA